MIINTSGKGRSFPSPCSLSRGAWVSSQGLPEKETGTLSDHDQSPVQLTASQRPCSLFLGGRPKARVSGPHCFHQPPSSDSCLQDQDWASWASRPAKSSGHVGQTNHPVRTLCVHVDSRPGPCAQELAEGTHNFLLLF